MILCLCNINGNLEMLLQEFFFSCSILIFLSLYVLKTDAVNHLVEGKENHIVSDANFILCAGSPKKIEQQECSITLQKERDMQNMDSENLSAARPQRSCHLLTSSFQIQIEELLEIVQTSDFLSP